MRFIWNLVHITNFETANKARLFLLITTVCCAVFGLAVWYIIGKAFMDNLSGALTFALCPAFFTGMLGGMWFLYQYDI